MFLRGIHKFTRLNVAFVTNNDDARAETISRLIHQLTERILICSYFHNRFIVRMKNTALFLLICFLSQSTDVSLNCCSDKTTNGKCHIGLWELELH